MLRHWVSLVLLVSTWTSFGNAQCSGYSPAFPLPKLDPKSEIIQEARRKIASILEKAIQKSDQNTTSFSVAVTSNEELLFELHHTARDRDEDRPGAETINGNSCYRIASCTKAFTILALLQQEKAGKLNLDDPVNKYVEDLNTPQDGELPWKDITLRTLATQLSGIPRDMAQDELLVEFEDPTTYGFPRLSPSEHHEIQCDSVTNYTKPCTEADLLDRLKSALPIFPPKQQSTYSNLNYELLSLVLANVTSTPYETLVETDILQALNLTSTSFTRPLDSVAALPKGISFYWDVVMGIQNPTGGLYSSTNDLTTFMRYALTHYNGLTPATNWFAPATYSTGLHNFYGMPWEIFRTDQILKPYTPRPVTLVTKGGGLPGYTSFIGAAPDHNFAFAILVAGPNGKVASTALDAVGTHMVRAADAIAHHTLASKYTGVWTDPTPAEKNSSIELAHDRPGRGGLYVKSWTSNGVDMLARLGRVGFPFIPSSARGSEEEWYLQVVPTLLFKDEANHRGEVWRFIGQRVPHHSHEQGEEDGGAGAVRGDLCTTDIDVGMYGGLPVNELVFWDPSSSGDDGSFRRLELTAFRVTLERDDGDRDGKLVVQGGK